MCSLLPLMLLEYDPGHNWLQDIMWNTNSLLLLELCPAINHQDITIFVSLIKPPILSFSGMHRSKWWVIFIFIWQKNVRAGCLENSNLHVSNISKCFLSLHLLFVPRHHSVSIYGDIKEHDGAVERPLRCQLLQDHSDPQELSREAGLRPVQRQHGDGLGELTVTKHSIHHAAGGHGQCAQCPQQRRDGGDNRSVDNKHSEMGEWGRFRLKGTPKVLTFMKFNTFVCSENLKIFSCALNF